MIFVAKRTITAVEYFALRENALGERIRFFREETGKLNSKEDYSTRAISKRLGVTAQSITAIERGESKNPSFQLVHGLSRELHVPIEAFTDEFYQGDIHLFEIGVVDENVELEDTRAAGLDPALSTSFHFGCYVYQAFQDGRMRFLYSKETKNAVDYKAFVESLSRFVAEIEMHSYSGELLELDDTLASPIKHAASLFKASLEYPKAFPILSKDSWNQAFNDFLAASQQADKGEMKND
ncbi:helix-turn-helix domain-containing protein [Paenibacillus sp. NRS-1783]|uniref:helix-turn-helix domain-containing protein n=1 Tax=Paenibacillus sp. NRS-1783 TaxID=3233907 RepID=UPI003D2A5ADF